MTNLGAIKNLFSKLSVRRDEEDMQHVTKNEEVKSGVPMSVQQEGTKKKKVRPEEKARAKEELTVEMKTRIEEAEVEGFREVRKVKRSEGESKGFWVPDESVKMNPKGGMKIHHFHPKGTKRMFDRHSGTGRGREISKGGAGGKTTWGDPDQYARETANNFMANEQESSDVRDETCNVFFVNNSI